MRVVVTGGKGFIGRRLTAELARRGDRVTALSRSADAVVHLMGAPAVGVRWDPIARVEPRPRTLLSASAVGYYGRILGRPVWLADLLARGGGG